MNQAVLYEGSFLPWDDSARHNKVLRLLTPFFVCFFFVIVIVTQFIEVPEKIHAIQQSEPERLVQWLNEPEPVPSTPPPPPKQEAAPEQPKPLIQQPPKIVPPAETIKPISPPKQEAPVQKLPKPSARAVAEQHASAFNAFSDLTTIDQEEALRGEHAELKDAEPIQDAPSSLRPTATELSRYAIEAKTQKQALSELESSSRTQITPSALSDSSAGTKLNNQIANDKRSSITASAAVRERTRSDIQRVFDENKTSLYSIYRRALRSNPSIKGTLVLALHIAPSGKVTKIDISDSDLGNSALEEKLLLRIKMINFGSMEVKPWSGQYPIEFLPSAV